MPIFQGLQRFFCLSNCQRRDIILTYILKFNQQYNGLALRVIMSQQCHGGIKKPGNPNKRLPGSLFTIQTPRRIA